MFTNEEIKFGQDIFLMLQYNSKKSLIDCKFR